MTQIIFSVNLWSHFNGFDVVLATNTTFDGKVFLNDLQNGMVLKQTCFKARDYNDFRLYLASNNVLFFRRSTFDTLLYIDKHPAFQRNNALNYCEKGPSPCFVTMFDTLLFIEKVRLSKENKTMKQFPKKLIPSSILIKLKN